MKRKKSALAAALLAAALLCSCGQSAAASGSAAQSEGADSASAGQSTSAPLAEPTAQGDVAEHTPDAITARGTLVAALVTDNVPYCFADNKGQQIGLDTAMANTFADDLQLEVEYRLCKTPEEALYAVYTGEADVALGSFGAEQAYLRWADFSNRYSGGPQALLVRKEDTKTMKTQQDLLGKVIAIVRGDAVQKEVAEKMLPDSQIVERGSMEKCIARLRGGQCSGVMMDVFVCDACNVDEPDLAASELSLAYEPAPEGAKVAVMPGNEALLAYLNSEIDTYTKTCGLGRLMISAQQKATNLGLME